MTSPLILVCDDTKNIAQSIVLMAMPEDEVRARAEECGAQGYLTKPFSKRSLLEAVGKHAPAPKKDGQPA